MEENASPVDEKVASSTPVMRAPADGRWVDNDRQQGAAQWVWVRW